jgi:hypothetical protein
MKDSLSGGDPVDHELIDDFWLFHLKKMACVTDELNRDIWAHCLG